MKKYLCLAIVLSFLTLSFSRGQSVPIDKGLQAISQDVIKAQLCFLASDWTEGRRAGEKGEYIASDYIASMLQLYGVKPGGDYIRRIDRTSGLSVSERTYFQNFVLLKTTIGEEQILKLKSVEGNTTEITSFTNGIDFSIRLSTSEIDIEAPIVFAGYGFVSDKLKFNDLDKIDINGKLILKISGLPKFASDKLTQDERVAAAREFENYAISRGAAGIVEFNPEETVVNTHTHSTLFNMSPSEYRPRPALTNTLWSIPGKNNPDNLIKITVSVKAANEIIKGTGMSIDDYMKKADKGSPYTFTGIHGKSVHLKSTRNHSLVRVRNVVGIIEGNEAGEVIVMGAHYDHMGINNGYIWNGADDNGSGTVGVMTIAKAIMESGEKPEKTIIAALWTAEEEGLLGSRYWVQNPTVPIKDVKLNVNFDMISRYVTDEEPDNVTMTYTSQYPSFKDITESNLKKFSIDLSVTYEPSPDPPGGSDHRSFVATGIPIMRFKPGHREEYHTPQDENETVDWDIMEKIIRISFANIWVMANTNW